jgi:hypothetical protein
VWSLIILACLLSYGEGRISTFQIGESTGKDYLFCPLNIILERWCLLEEGESTTALHQMQSIAGACSISHLQSFARVKERDRA